MVTPPTEDELHDIATAVEDFARDGEHMEELRELYDDLPADRSDDPYYGGRVKEIVLDDNTGIESNVTDLSSDIEEAEQGLNVIYNELDEVHNVMMLLSDILERLWEMERAVDDISRNWEDVQKDPTQGEAVQTIRNAIEVLIERDDLQDMAGNIVSEAPSQEDMKEAFQRQQVRGRNEFDQI